MKKFISALTSLAIATTALGGTIVLSADAADKTIIEFQSKGKNTIEAAAGDTVPVTVYVPQCTGANTFSLKMSINGAETLGVGVDETADELAKIKAEAEKTKDEKAKADYLAVEHWLYGNYGIKTANEKFATPYCFDSGMYQDGMGGGDYELSMSYFLKNTWNINLTLSSFVGKNANADNYGAFVKKVGEAAAAEYDFSEGDYEPVTTWTTEDSFAYDYALATFDLVLPDNLPNGTYTLDILRDKYINIVSHQWAQSSVSGKDGKVEFDTVPLKITVGGGSVETGTTATTTTGIPGTTGTTAGTTVVSTAGGTTANVDKPAKKEGTVQYDLLVDGKECGFDGTNNTIEVEPGQQIKVNWVVSNDPGTAGMQMHFDFGKMTGVKRTAGKAYKAAVQWNEETFAYVWASDKTLTAADDSVIASFTMTAPTAAGTYKLGLKDTDGPNIVRPLEDGDDDIPYTFYGLAVKVGEPGDETGTTASQTTQGETTGTTAGGTQVNVEKPAPKEGTVQYDLVVDGATNGFNGKNNTATVAPGATVKVNWVVSNDPGTAGMQMHLDFGDLKVKRTAGKAYKAAVQWNEDTYAYVWASDKTLTAADDSVIASFSFTAPTEKGTYTFGLKSTDGPNIVRPLEDGDDDIPYNFYGLVLTVGDPDETNESTTQTTVTTETTVTTSEGTTSSQGGESSTTATTAGDGNVVYGDVNEDGQIRINDVVLLNKYIAGTANLTDQGKKNADCVKDSKYDAKDATAIMKFLAKLISRDDLGKEA